MKEIYLVRKYIEKFTVGISGTYFDCVRKTNRILKYVIPFNRSKCEFNFFLTHKEYYL